jgi:hydroxymethylpyrimidine pyrophosphatase-like HAD family hydrolase
MIPVALAFDVDNTLTPPRRPLRGDMAEALKRLTVPFALAAGSDLNIVHDQFFAPLHAMGFRGGFDAFLCNGASRYHCDCGERLEVKVVEDFAIDDHLGPELTGALLAILERSLAEPDFQLPPPLGVIGERIIHRKSMINLAPIGRPKGGNLAAAAQKNRDAFVEFDERTGYRKRYLQYLRHAIAALTASKNLVVTYGGQTSFDFVIRGRDKTYPVRALLDAGAAEVLYFGDALFEGGNDAAVLDLIHDWPTQPCPVKAVVVSSCEQTLERLHALGFLAA